MKLSSRAAGPALALALVCAALPAQYPGQLANSPSGSAKDTPTLRAISVLEWTGDETHPKASRLVPVAIYDGSDLQDAGVYLARPAPLAVLGDVEYELQRNGLPIGLYDIKNAAQEQGAWVGYGAWKAKPKPKSKAASPVLPLNPSWSDQDDRPVLHRKHHPGDAPAKSGSPDSTSDSKTAPASDPDRPVLHKKAETGDSSASSPAAADPDRPTLHKKAQDSGDTDSTTAQEPAPDPDRPTLRKKQPEPSGKKKKKSDDVGYVDSRPNATDPDRPKLKRGKAESAVVDVLPSLLGLPPDLQQAVAVSDVRDRDAHSWAFTWADPADRDKMKAALEQIARDALGLTPPPAPTPVPVPVKSKTGRKRSVPAAAPAPPPEPAPLLDEDFRVFELTYGSGATLVLTAHTGGSGAADKHIVLIAQPDLYGNALVLFKNVTDAAHLDTAPRFRLVDAVDAQADNRGELLFELRGQTERQFALYRVYHGQAERIFVTAPAGIAAPLRDHD